MKQLHMANANGHWLPESNMYKVANSLLKHNSEYVIDYKVVSYAEELTTINSDNIKEKIFDRFLWLKGK